MRLLVTLLGGLLLVGCGQPSVGGTAASRPRTASPGPVVAAGATTPPAQTPGPGSPCSELPNARQNLVLARLSGQPRTVVRDVSDLEHPRTLCTLPAELDGIFASQAEGFASPTVISYAPKDGASLGSGSIRTYDLATGTNSELVHLSGAGFFSGMHSWSPDGQVLTYLDSAPGAAVSWHLRQGARDIQLASLPAVPGRGISEDKDSADVGFSPDGQYVAFVQTFTGEGQGDQARFQVRKLDGTLVFSRAEGRWVTWATHDRLYFTDGQSIRFWDPQGGEQSQLAGDWIAPRASADGKRVAYVVRDGQKLPEVSVLEVDTGAVVHVSNNGRGMPILINQNMLWYVGFTLCPSSECPLTPTKMTGAAYLYDLRDRAESRSQLAGVLDVWPRSASTV